ncbi:MAG TPA: hypothetical protein VK689_13445, partial [Armatimonadota bacterium]|nr:hypothetical protein [Armatimonadota bacterium]
MGKRPRAALACLVFAGLGAALALADYRSLIAFPMERWTAFQQAPPIPRGILWIGALRRPYDLLDTLERPLLAVAVVLALLAFGILGGILSPSFRLFKPPGEHTGSGATAHL